MALPVSGRAHTNSHCPGALSSRTPVPCLQSRHFYFKVITRQTCNWAPFFPKRVRGSQRCPVTWEVWYFLTSAGAQHCWKRPRFLECSWQTSTWGKGGQCGHTQPKPPLWPDTSSLGLSGVPHASRPGLGGGPWGSRAWGPAGGWGGLGERERHHADETVPQTLPLAHGPPLIEDHLAWPFPVGGELLSGREWWDPPPTSHVLVTLDFTLLGPQGSAPPWVLLCISTSSLPNFYSASLGTWPSLCPPSLMRCPVLLLQSSHPNPPSCLFLPVVLDPGTLALEAAQNISDKVLRRPQLSAFLQDKENALALGTHLLMIQCTASHHPVTPGDTVTYQEPLRMEHPNWMWKAGVPDEQRVQQGFSVLNWSPRSPPTAPRACTRVQMTFLTWSLQWVLPVHL